MSWQADLATSGSLFISWKGRPAAGAAFLFWTRGFSTGTLFANHFGAACKHAGKLGQACIKK